MNSKIDQFLTVLGVLLALLAIFLGLSCAPPCKMQPPRCAGDIVMICGADERERPAMDCRRVRWRDGTRGGRCVGDKELGARCIK